MYKGIAKSVHLWNSLETDQKCPRQLFVSSWCPVKNISPIKTINSWAVKFKNLKIEVQLVNKSIISNRSHFLSVAFWITSAFEKQKLLFSLQITIILDIQSDPSTIFQTTMMFLQLNNRVELRSLLVMERLNLSCIWFYSNWLLIHNLLQEVFSQKVCHFAETVVTLFYCRQFLYFSWFLEFFIIKTQKVLKSIDAVHLI